MIPQVELTCFPPHSFDPLSPSLCEIILLYALIFLDHINIMHKILTNCLQAYSKIYNFMVESITGNYNFQNDIGSLYFSGKEVYLQVMSCSEGSYFCHTTTHHPEHDSSKAGPDRRLDFLVAGYITLLTGSRFFNPGRIGATCVASFVLFYVTQFYFGICSAC
ncbi:hypothetical protein KSP39_PZI018667 [Platanthera zijinensis]|uniref:Uncharacterized protein n=1 Tax=Platanthera zijinensis TaxID=2320716 RepID=A0AAP0FZD5_9ASPA